MQRITAFEADIEMQPWFGPQEQGAAEPSTDELCAAFWGGCGFPVSEFLVIKRRWALAKRGCGTGGAPLPPAAPCRPLRAADDGAAEAKKGRGGGEGLTVWVSEGGGEGARGSLGVWCGRAATRGLDDGARS